MKLDRFGRNMYDSLTAIRRLKDYGVELKSITENTEDKIVLAVLLAVAEQERENTIYRTRIGKQRSLDNGKWIGGVPPYGYVVNKETKKLKLYDEKVLLGKYSEVDVIKKIYSLITTNKLSCEKVTTILNEENIPPCTPGKNKLKRKKAEYWSGPRIRNLIKDEIYKGEKIIGKRAKKDGLNKVIKVSPIVSADIWEKAQDVLKSNLIQSMRHTKRQYLLTGKIKCSKCDRNFTGVAYGKLTYYVCNNNRLKNKNNPTKCFNKAMRADVIENEIWDDLKHFINNPLTIKNFLHQRLSEVSRVDVKKELRAIDYKFKKLQLERLRLIKFIRMGDDCLEANIKVEIEKIKNEELKLSEERKYYEELSKKEEFEKRKISEIEKVLTLFVDKIKNPDFKLKKEIINIMVDKVVVYPYKKGDDKRLVEIQYSFKKTGSVITKLSLTG